MQPLPTSELVRRAAMGDAIAIEKTPRRGVTRRSVLRGGVMLGIASVLATMSGVIVDFLWQRNVSGFGAVVMPGVASDFPPGSKTKVTEGKFWLVNLTAEQGGPGFLALWQKCPHLGCVVPWLESFKWVDPTTGHEKAGWFRCSCHQSTYNDAGVRVYGPAPRSMDRMAVQVTEKGYVEVDTGAISKGSEDNASFAVPAQDV
jgi:cytochrome b6-f complex iron-sulfur subunit